MATGTVRDVYTDGRGWGCASLGLTGGGHTEVLLPERPGVRLLAGDLTPTLVDALRDAIEHLGSGEHGRDPEWVAPEVLDRLERYERALDALRGGFFDEERPAAPARIYP